MTEGCLTPDVLALPLRDHDADGLVLLHLVLLEPRLAGRLVVGLAHLLPLAHRRVVAHLPDPLVADLHLLLEHLQRRKSYKKGRSAD